MHDDDAPPGQWPLGDDIDATLADVEYKILIDPGVVFAIADSQVNRKADISALLLQHPFDLDHLAIVVDEELVPALLLLAQRFEPALQPISHAVNVAHTLFSIATAPSFPVLHRLKRCPSSLYSTDGYKIKLREPASAANRNLC